MPASQGPPAMAGGSLTSYLRHPLDLALEALPPESTGRERLELVWKAYTADTGDDIGIAPTQDERKKVYEWLREQSIPPSVKPKNPPYMLNLRARRSTVYLPVSIDIPGKVNRLAQLGCPACEVVVDDNGGHPLYVATKPIKTPPWTMQSARQRNTIIVKAIQDQLKPSSISKPWDGPVCITIAAVEPKIATKKDVDNLVKGLLDGLQGVLYTNDNRVQCLTSRRFEYSGSFGYYMVSARAVYPWDDDIVYDNPKDPVVLSGNVVVPEDAER